jgi:hypothetical protein
LCAYCAIENFGTDVGRRPHNFETIEFFFEKAAEPLQQALYNTFWAIEKIKIENLI